jgi:hypothetical protein
MWRRLLLVALAVAAALVAAAAAAAAAGGAEHDGVARAAPALSLGPGGAARGAGAVGAAGAQQAQAVAPDVESAQQAQAPPSADGWRELGADESVPRGSHVQLNLATGKKYVKEQVRGDISRLSGLDGKALASAEMMERVLYSLPQPDPRLPSAAERAKLSPQEYQALLDKVWANRQAEIKRAFEAIDNEPGRVSNGTLLLLRAAHEPDGVVLDTLDALEWLVQDIDNALHFGNIGGLDACAQLIATHPSAAVRAGAAFVAGTAIKNQERLQAAALKAGLVVSLLDRLAAGPPSAAAAAGAVEAGKLLYALGAALRGHDPAVSEALQAGLLPLLARLAHPAAPLDVRARAKALAMAADSFQWAGLPERWRTDGLLAPLCDALRAAPAAPADSPEARAVAARLADALSAAQCCVDRECPAVLQVEP